MTFRVSPGVYTEIIDDSLQATYTNPSIAALTGGGLRGPLGPNLVTGYKQSVTQYGYANPSWGFMIDSGNAFLLQGTNAWFNRVVSADAMYGLGLIANNWTSGVGGTPKGTSFTTLPGGSPYDYTQLNPSIWDLEITGLFVASDTCSVTINSSTTSVVNFTNNHNDTMRALQAAIQTTLNTIGAGGYVDLPVTGSNFHILRIFAPLNPQTTIATLTATMTGPSQPPYLAYETDYLAVVVADNPGSWSGPGNSSGTPGVAVGVSNIDTGTPQRVTFSLSSAILSAQTIRLTINGTPISAVFATNNNTTLTNLIAAYSSAFPGGSGSLVPSLSSNDLQFTLVAPDSVTKLSVSVQEVTGTGTLPLVSSTVTLNNTPSTGSFNFTVYENATFASPSELYLCTYQNGTDGLGNPTGLAYVINGIPGATAAASPRVKVVVNSSFSGTLNGSTNVTSSANAMGLPNERYLGGGADGSIPSTQQVVAGWTEYNNPENITVRILINAGYTDPAVQQEMLSICAHRMDCFSILDIPSMSQDVTDAINFRNNVMDIDSFWGAVYTPDILIYDSNLGVRRYVPPSGIVAGSYAYTDRVAAEWFSPAGLNRGIIQQALGARFIYEEGDRDALSSAQINAIRKYGPAWVIWGEYTLQQVMSALQSVAVVRLMITVMTESASICAYSVFEPNNPFTWHKITTRLNAILEPIQRGQGIVDFLVQCNASNNTPDIIDERVCLVAMWIKPVLSILYLKLDGIVTRQSAIFSVEAAAASNAF